MTIEAKKEKQQYLSPSASPVKKGNRHRGNIYGNGLPQQKYPGVAGWKFDWDSGTYIETTSGGNKPNGSPTR